MTYTVLYVLYCSRRKEKGTRIGTSTTQHHPTVSGQNSPHCDRERIPTLSWGGRGSVRSRQQARSSDRSASKAKKGSVTDKRLTALSDEKGHDHRHGSRQSQMSKPKVAMSDQL